MRALLRTPFVVMLLVVLSLGRAAAAEEVATEGGDAGVLATLGQLALDGGILMIPIALASVLMVGLALERVWALRRGRIGPAALWPKVRESLAQGELDEARAQVSGEESPLARVLHAGLLQWEDDTRDVSAALEDAGLRESDDMQKNLPALQGVASVAPLLGLLGTVVGMIKSFLVVARESAMGNPELLAEGIGQALVTTAAGLSVAIPALILFYMFRGRIRKLVRELDNVARGVLEVHREGSRHAHSAA